MNIVVTIIYSYNYNYNYNDSYNDNYNHTYNCNYNYTYEQNYKHSYDYNYGYATNSPTCNSQVPPSVQSPKRLRPKVSLEELRRMVPDEDALEAQRTGAF